MAVVELRHVVAVYCGGEGAEGARLFFQFGGEEYFAFRHFGQLGNDSQPFEIDVGAGQYGGEDFALNVVFADVFLDAGQSYGTGSLGNGPGVVEDVAGGRADLFGGDGDAAVEAVFQDLEGKRSQLLDRDALGEKVDLVQDDALAFVHGGLAAGAALGLDSEDFHFRAESFDIARHAGNKAAAAHRDEDGVELFGILPEELHGDGALAGDDVLVVVRMDEAQAFFLREIERVGAGFVEVVAVDYDFGAQSSDVVDLYAGRRFRHDDRRLAAVPGGRQGHALGVVAGACRDDASLKLFFFEGVDLLVGAPQLERENFLLVFAFQQDGVVKFGAQNGHLVQGRLFRDFIDGSRDDLFNDFRKHFYILFNQFV